MSKVAKVGAELVKKAANAQDPRIVAMKTILYDPALLKNKPELSHFPIPPLSCPPLHLTSIDSPEAKRDTVERAWLLLKQEEASAFKRQLKAQYSSMRKAMELLEKRDARLFQGALVKRLDRFPLKTRIATDTPPLNGFPTLVTSLDSQ